MKISCSDCVHRVQLDHCGKVTDGCVDVAGKGCTFYRKEYLQHYPATWVEEVPDHAAKHQQGVFDVGRLNREVKDLAKNIQRKGSKVEALEEAERVNVIMRNSNSIVVEKLTEEIRELRRGFRSLSARVRLVEERQE